MKLRPYQEEAVAALRAALNGGMKNPLVCLPTGSGKTPTICAFADASLRKGHRVTVAVHTQELVDQIAKTYERITGYHAGVYSASLKRKEHTSQFTIVQIQSAANVPGLFADTRLLIVDECDRIPPDGEGQYQTFIAALRNGTPDMRVVGFTATPYRMTTGLVYGGDGLFCDMVYDANIRDLIAQGYLSPLRAKDGGAPDLSKVHVRNGEYVAEELEAIMADDEKVEAAVREIVHHGASRNHGIVFVSGDKHGHMVLDSLHKHGQTAVFVTAKTPSEDRKRAVQDFKEGRVKYLVNIVLFTVGFDHPGVDLIADMAPTKSPGRYYQKLGRGFRICDGKTDCLVLDYAGNVLQHGPVDLLNDSIHKKEKGEGGGEAPAKSCPECHELVHASVAACPVCGHKFPRIIAKHQAKSGKASPISGRSVHDVGSVMYNIQPCRDRSKPDMLKITYFDQSFPPNKVSSELIPCDSHYADASYLRRQFLAWVRQTPLIETDDGRSLAVRGSVLYGKHGEDEAPIHTAIQLAAFRNCFSIPTRITTIPNPDNPKYTTVVGREFACPQKQSA